MDDQRKGVKKVQSAIFGVVFDAKIIYIEEEGR